MTLKLLLHTLLLTAVVGGAQAVPITGSIGFTGPYTANNTDLTAATLMTFGTVEVTGVHDGAFSGIATGTVTTTPATLSVNPTVLPAVPIWSVGGFALTLSSLIETYNDSMSLNMQGAGTLTGPAGSDPTPGVWIATFNRAGTNFTFSASSAATPSVPEGGSTLLLLGLGLVGVAIAARRLRN